MTRTPSLILGEVLDQVIPAAQVSVDHDSAALTAADYGVRRSHAFLAICRKASRDGQLFDAAVAAVCALAHEIHYQETLRDQADQTTPPPSGQSDAETVGDREQPDLGGGPWPRGLDGTARN